MKNLLAIFLLILLSVNGRMAQAQTTNNYSNADVLLSSVLDRMQYPIPKNVKATDGNHLNFSQATSTPNNPTGDEVRYVAAYKFCEHLVPAFPTPTHGTNRSLTIDDIQSINADRNDTALKSAAMEECFAAVAYRTSCPSASSSSFTLVGASANCFTLQKNMCHYLKDAPTKGLGIDGIGDQEADYALKNCDTDGLSPAMYDKIFSHRCDNAAYVQNLGSVLSSAPVVEQMIQFECPAAKDRFEAKLDRERERILIATQTLLQLRQAGGTAAHSPTSGPVGTSTGTGQ